MASINLTVGQNEYKKLTDVEHVLQKPGMYIGDVSQTPRYVQMYNNNKIEYKKTIKQAGFCQCFLEGLANAADNVQRSREANIDPRTIEINIDDKSVSIKNYGMAIPISKNEKDIWIPWMIFGNLRAGSNFKEKEKNFFIGTNGMGIKLSNIFSLKFTVKCGDPERKLMYIQSWKNHMNEYDEPTIESYNGIGFVEVIFEPDFKYFNLEKHDDELISIYTANCLMISYACSIPVIVNGKYFNIKNIEEYSKLFFEMNKKNTIEYRYVNGDEKVEFYLIDTPNNAIIVSFVNGVPVPEGVHIDEIYNKTLSAIKNIYGKDSEGIRWTKKDIDEHISIFINCRISNPMFKSQTKEYLTKPIPKIEIDENQFKKIKSWESYKIVKETIEKRQITKLNKGTKKNKKIYDGKIEDANFAGTSKSELTTGFIVEGDSAKYYPEVWISQYPKGEGKNYYGICPIQGKILNVMNASFKEIFENKQIARLKSFYGLDDTIDYRDLKDLKKMKYGNIVLMADADDDGIHITGLLLVYFCMRFPGLVEHGKVKMLLTPIIRAEKGKQKRNFFTKKSFEVFKAKNPDWESWKYSYFKGLGSSNEEHIKEDYKNPKFITFKMDEKTKDMLALAFSKKNAKERKDWLIEWMKKNVVDIEEYKDIPVSIYIDNIVPYYIVETIYRAIPSIYDGLKEAQRKILYAAFIEVKNEYVKVSELANEASKRTGYKHGTVSLEDTIIKMTQNFVGSNNMSYFFPNGGFGTRQNGGNDACAGRYISVKKVWWWDYIFKKDDKCLLTNIKDEGKDKEYINYLPILPLHLINGVNGVGMAWSTDIPPHNPLDIAFYIQSKLKGYPLPYIRPWFKNFTGQILIDGNNFITTGTFKVNKDNIVVSELPIGVYNNKYTKFLDNLKECGLITDFSTLCTHDKPHFVITGWYSGQVIISKKDDKKIIEKYMRPLNMTEEEKKKESKKMIKTIGPPSYKNLGLFSTFSYSNMSVIVPTNDSFITKTYKVLNEFLEDFFTLRFEKYGERIKMNMLEYEKKIQYEKEKIRYIELINKGDIIIKGRTEKDLENDLTKYQLPLDLLDNTNDRQKSDKGLEKIKNNLIALIDKYNFLKNIKPEELWSNEIDEFVNAYIKNEPIYKRPVLSDFKEASCEESKLYNDIIEKVIVEKKEKKKKHDDDEYISNEEDDDLEDIFKILNGVESDND